MRKIFIAALTFSLLVALTAQAQQNQNEQPSTTKKETETALDKEADRLNIVPYEKRFELKRQNTKAINMKLKNSRKGEISDLIKNINQMEKRAARLEGRTAETQTVDPRDKESVRKFLQKDLFIYPYPRFY